MPPPPPHPPPSGPCPEGPVLRPGAYDVVTLGESMLRLTPPGLRRLDQAAALDLEVGGSEANVAVGLARLGLRTAWLSRLTDNPVGRLVERAIAAHGVDTSRVAWTDRDRVGLYYLEDARPPRAPRVTYDRAGSAMSRMTPRDLPADLFAPGKARWLHLSGITPALGPDAAAAASRAVELAKSAGWAVSFDLNYRARLWSADDARRGCDPFAAEADVLIVSLRDARQVLGVTPAAPREAAGELSARYPAAVVVLTLSKDGAAGLTPGGKFHHQPAFVAEGEVGRIGGGDAFGAGFLYAHLTRSADDPPRRLADALRWGCAAAALKYATPGDMPLIDRDAVERLADAAAAAPGGDVMR